ncbi:MAG: hypothetical protein LAP87_18765 [Acidobacteriia bacterium]|nr:hypothetical protein [Terriglobia bacterium]
MTMISGVFGGVFVVAYLAIVIFVIWKFYEALARIGRELSDMKTILRDGLSQISSKPRDVA